MSEPLEVPKDESVKENPPIQLIITLFNDGRITVNGPIKDKILSYGLLELAKDEIRHFHEKADKASKIEVVKNGHGIINFARRLNGK